jgi:hypothetical protein
LLLLQKWSITTRKASELIQELRGLYSAEWTEARAAASKEQDGALRDEAARRTFAVYEEVLAVDLLQEMCKERQRQVK